MLAPRALHRACILILLKESVLVLLCSVIMAQESMAVANRRGRYESYASPIRSVMNRLENNSAAFGDVCQLMRRGRQFRYRMHHPYRACPPEVTESLREGCCKDKSLWLASRMNDGSVRYVIGRAHRSSNGLHAWLHWQSGGRTWVLDCTNHSSPLRRDRLPPGEYVALYQWSKGD